MFEQTSPLVRFVRRFDFFPKYESDIIVRTPTGGIVTTIAVLIALVLFFSETYDFIWRNREDTILVDLNRERMMTVTFDIVFPGLKCEYTTMDAVDETGESHSQAIYHIKKVRVRNNGDPIKGSDEKHVVLGDKTGACMPCFAMDLHIWFGSIREKCCTCEEVKKAFTRVKWLESRAQIHPLCMEEQSRHISLPDEGCEVKGTMVIPRAKGNFHIAAGHSGQANHGGHSHHVHQIHPNKVQEMQDKFRVQHVIKILRFGDGFPGQSNPLEGVSLWTEGLLRHIYMVQIVPTRYELGAMTINSNQYTFSNHTEQVDTSTSHWHLPGVFFKYDFSPMMTVLGRQERAFSHYITRLMALLGGIYVVLGLVYNFLRRAMSIGGRRRAD